MAEYIDRNLCELLAEYDQYYTLVVPLSKIRKLPAADVAPVVHGRWESTGLISCKCSVCQHLELKGNEEYLYCPHCGAKMDGGAHEAD
jgi:hypothetical protein